MKDAKKVAKEPEVKEPEVKEPEVKEPEVKEPEVKEPEVKEPEVKVDFGVDEAEIRKQLLEDIVMVNQTREDSLEQAYGWIVGNVAAALLQNRPNCMDSKHEFDKYVSDVKKVVNAVVDGVK